MWYLLSLKLKEFQIVLCRLLFIHTKSCHTLTDFFSPGFVVDAKGNR